MLMVKGPGVPVEDMGRMIGRYLMFFHGSSADGLEMHAAHGHGTLALAWSDNLSDWYWKESGN